jgi:hypothetical protein
MASRKWKSQAVWEPLAKQNGLSLYGWRAFVIKGKPGNWTLVSRWSADRVSEMPRRPGAQSFYAPQPGDSRQARRVVGRENCPLVADKNGPVADMNLPMRVCRPPVVDGVSGQGFDSFPV